MNIKERLGKIIEIRNIKQVEFAETLKIDQSYVSKLLSQKSNAVPSERLIDDICESYDINKEWLVNGTGKMDIDYELEDRFGKAMDLIFKDTDPFIRNMIIEIANLPKEERETMREAIAIIKKITSSI